MPIQLQSPPDSIVRRKRHAQISKEPIPTSEQSLRTSTKKKVATPEGILHALGKRIGSHKLGMWFGHTTLGVERSQLLVQSDSQFVADWIESHFVEELEEVATEMLGAQAKVIVSVSSVKAGDAQTDSSHAAAANGTSPAADGGSVGGMQPKPRNDSRQPRADLRRLDDFVVGVSNRMAFAAACRIVEEPDARRISPVFIHGECGLGKTHLLQGICHRYIQQTGRAQHVRYVTGEQFTNEYITAIRNNTIDSFRQKNRKLDLLAIDDVHFLSNKVRTQTEFLYTLDAIDLSGARVVLASDNHPHHIKRFNQALVSRFLSGMVVKIEKPERAMRVELIARLATSRGMEINHAAIESIADNCLGSVRELEGAITKLAAFRSLLHDTPTGTANAISTQSNEVGLVLTDQLFREHAWQPSQTVRMSTLIEVICNRLGVSKAEVLSSGRHRRVVLARGLIAYLGRELTTHSFPEIAQHLGRNNHSTIHTADQRLRKQVLASDVLQLGGGEPPIGLKDLIDQLRRAVLERHRQAA